MRKVFLICIGVIILVSCAKQDISVSSPDGTIKLLLSNDKLEDGTSKLQYSVEWIDGEKIMSVMDKSPLGITLEEMDFSSNLSIVNTVNTIVDEKYTMKIGSQKELHNHANEMVVMVKNADEKEMQIAFRAYNNGIAFKYIFSQEDDKVHTVLKEESGFSIPMGGKAWLQKYDTIKLWSPAYETYWENGVDVGTPAPAEQGWSFPALFKSGAFWMFVSEANVTPSYCGSHLEQNCDNGLYKIRFPESFEWLGEESAVFPQSKLPFETPWRFVTIATSARQIATSNIVYHLSDANTITDDSWIKPGRAAWSWWGDHDSPRNIEKQKKFVDFAKEMGWEYSLVDANWNKMYNGDTITELVDYAKEKSIGLILWYNSGGPHNTITEEPRDVMNDPVKRREHMKMMQEWGIKGIKVDFFQSDKQAAIQLYHDILKDAADYHILVNFHGCTTPRGWSRTYPNLMTMEAIMGAEQYWSVDFAREAPTHHTIIPFTRNVQGPMDYTPVTFGDDKAPHTTSFAHELALSVIFESGITHFADRVEGYKEQPEYVRAFLSDIPVTWNESICLDGEPGEKVTFARRSGKTWYIAGINGQLNEQRSTKFKFDFLEETDKEYEVTFITDGEELRSWSTESYFVKKNDLKKIIMEPRGGFVMVVK